MGLTLKTYTLNPKPYTLNQVLYECSTQALVQMEEVDSSPPSRL